MRTLVLSALCWGVLFGASVAVAEIFTVRPDGTGDYPTIQTAIDAAVDGDVIELTDGTFAGDGNRDVDYLGKAVTVRSQNGPEACIVNCEGSETDPHRGFHFHLSEGPGSVLQGVTITGGWIDLVGGGVQCEGPTAVVITGCVLTGNTARRGGGIGCRDGSAPTIENCVFEENDASWSGGGLYAVSATPTVTDCVFHANHANHGAGMYLYGNADPILTDCVFTDNSADHSTGGLHCEHFVRPTLHNCTFSGNTSMYQGCAMGISIVSSPTLYNCTFWGNGGTSPVPAIANGEECESVFENTIIAGTVEGMALRLYDGLGSATLRCCDIYGNEGGDWVDHIADQLGIDGNICEDPLFCDPATGDFTLQETSPCAPSSPPNVECDQIGAWPIGCGGTPVTATTWGGIKAMFRR